MAKPKLSQLTCVLTSSTTADCSVVTDSDGDLYYVAEQSKINSVPDILLWPDNNETPVTVGTIQFTLAGLDTTNQNYLSLFQYSNTSIASDVLHSVIASIATIDNISGDVVASSKLNGGVVVADSITGGVY